MLKLLYLEWLTLQRRSCDWLNPIIFFFVLITLFAIILQTEKPILQALAPALLWISILLSQLLSLDKLFQLSYEEGSLDFVLMSKQSCLLTIVSKLFIYWLIYSAPFIFFAPIAAYLLTLPFSILPNLLISLLIGTPIIVVIGAVGASLTIGIKQKGLLLPIITFPFYVPILLLATGILQLTLYHEAINAKMAVLLAFMIFTVGFSPFAIAAALRLGVSNLCTH